MSWNILPKNVLQYFLEKIKSKFMLIWNHDILGAKNILPFPYTYGSGTNYGLTITVHEDGSITAQGTPTQTIMFLINDNIIENLSLWQGSEMIFSEWEVQNQNAFAALLLGQSTPISEVRGDYKLTVTSEMIQQGVAFILYFGNGVDLTTPITFKPMVRLATDPDHTWRSPALTNKQLTDSVFYLSYAKSHVSANPSTTTGVLNGLEIDGTAYEIQGTGEPNVQADWNEVDSTADDYIKNKPTIPAAQVNADWNASSGVSAILNKPTIPTYNFLGVNFHSGNGSSQEHNCNNMTENGLYYYQSNGPSDLGEQSTDGAVLVMAHSTNWLTQLAQDYRTGKIYVRSRKNGAWQSWIRVDYADGMRYTGTATDCFTVHQTSGSFMGRSGWASYLIANHGNGATYYSQTIALPFWGVPLYRRLEGGTDKGWKEFITAENIGSQSVNYANSAGNASKVNNLTVQTAVPANAKFTDTNNAVTQTNTTGNASYRVLYSATADDTDRTEGTRKGRIYFNPSTGAFWASNGSNQFQIGNNYLYLNGKITLIQAGNQQLTISATTSAGTETNYRVALGVFNRSWAFKPFTDKCLTLGQSSERWGQIYSSNSAISTSDRKEKKDIVSLDEFARTLIMSLNPVSYKFKDGESGRTHYGMIAQDVEDSLEELGITPLDIAAFCKDKKLKDISVFSGQRDSNGNPIYDKKQVPIPGEYTYGLRYEEFIAPLIKTVQLQQQEIEELKHRIDILEGK